MRTTLRIDDDLLATAKEMARERSVSVGSVVSELMRKGLRAGVGLETKIDLPVFRVGKDAGSITLEDVKRMEDEP